MGQSIGEQQKLSPKKQLIKRKKSNSSTKVGYNKTKLINNNNNFVTKRTSLHPTSVEQACLPIQEPATKPRLHSSKNYYTDLAEDLVIYWNKLGVRTHKRHGPVYNKSIKEVSLLLQGTHPRFSRKFKPEDITQAMDEFARAALDPEVKPYSKKNLRRKSLPEFIYCDRHTTNKSLFAHYLIHNPERKDEMPYELNPELTKILKKKWQNEMLGGMNVEYWNQTEEKVFIIAANKITRMYKQNKSKFVDIMINHKWRDLADALWSCIEEGTNYNIGRVNIHWLVSDVTHRRFQQYLARNGYIDRSGY